MDPLTAFEDYLLGVGLATRTVAMYVRHLERITDALAVEGGSVDTVSARELVAYLEQVPNSSSTRRQLRSTLTYYWQMTGRFDGPVRAVRVPPKPGGICRALTVGDARLLAKTATGWHPEGLAVQFGLYMGLRREEIATIRWDRFDRAYEWYTCFGKGGRTRTVPVHPILQHELADMPTRYVWLFPGRSAPHVRPITIWDWTKRVAVEAGIGEIQVHQLRHTCLATINDLTGDLRGTQDIAGHVRPDTTSIYTRVKTERMRRLVDGINYLGGDG